MHCTGLPIFILLSLSLQVVLAGTAYDYNTDDYNGDYVDDYKLEEIDTPSYICPGEHIYIEISLLCDGFKDCLDGMDENVEICKIYGRTTTESPSPMIHTAPPTTADPLDYFDYGNCEAGTYQCPSYPGLCLVSETLCDGRADCPGGEDETNCHGSARPDLHSYSASYDNDIRMSGPSSSTTNSNNEEEVTRIRTSDGEVRTSTNDIVDPLENNIFYAKKKPVVPAPSHTEYSNEETTNSNSDVPETGNAETPVFPALISHNRPTLVVKKKPTIVKIPIKPIQEFSVHSFNAVYKQRPNDKQAIELGETESVHHVPDPSTLSNEEAEAMMEAMLAGDGSFVPAAETSTIVPATTASTPTTETTTTAASTTATTTTESTTATTTTVENVDTTSPTKPCKHVLHESSVRKQRKKVKGLLGQLMRQMTKLAASDLDNSNVNLSIKIGGSDHPSSTNDSESPSTSERSKEPKIRINLELVL
ncbi:uncharacterized protein LOC100185579 isoform X2 [Ciona intestinalis]